jgi:OMF family outer membrane factor
MLQIPIGPLLNKKRSPAPYAREIEKQEINTPVGEHPVTSVAPSGVQSPSVTQQYPDSSIENSVEIRRPALQALISVEDKLNPYTLDAGRAEEVTFKDVLLAAEGGNLDILNTRYGVNAQKYTYLSAASQFLPDLLLGYNEFAVNGRIPVPISAVAKAATGTGGTPVVANTTETIIRTGITQLTSGFTLRVYKPSTVFTMLVEKHRLYAERARLKTDVSNTLLSAARDYYNLLLSQAVLQIRILAVDISEEQFHNNSMLLNSGLATNLDVLQSKAQLARDRQNLVDQQRVRRNSAITLSHLLNLNLGQDLTPADPLLRKCRLISKQLPVGDLVRIAIDNRPELKQYEELRQVAKRNILLASAPLQPSVTLGGNIYGVGSNLGNMGPVYLLNFGVRWNIGGMGLTDTANINSSRWKARQALVQANQQFLDVIDEVRSTYNDSLAAERRIDQAIDEIAAAREELRLARIRLDTGLGINIDVLNAQRDLTQAYIDKAQAIADFNIAQVRLLHDIGLISVNNLTAGRLISSVEDKPPVH